MARSFWDCHNGLRIMRPLVRLGLIVGEISWKHGKCWMVEVIKSTNPSNVGLPNDLTHRSCSGSTTPARYQKKFRSLVARILPGSFAQSVRHSANVFQTNSTGCLSESTCPVQLWLSWWESGAKHRQACQRTDYKLSRYICSLCTCKSWLYSYAYYILLYLSMSMMVDT